MKTITPGHKYELANFENPSAPGQIIQFIEKVASEKSDGSGHSFLRTVNDGTTNEEVLKMLIDRMQVLTAKVPSRESSITITKLEEALHWLTARTIARRARDVEGTDAP
jgi:cob(I)alamin adenosyltransferase